MRIATFVSSCFTTPAPRNIVYAPMDIAISLSMGMERKGHEVTFFAPIGSEIKINKIETLGLLPLDIQSFGVDENDFKKKVKVEQLYDQYFIAEIYLRAAKGEFDLLHIHPVDRVLPFGKAFPKIPVIYTLHDEIEMWRAKMMKLFQTGNQHFVSISDYQRNQLGELNYAGTVYNGIDTGVFFYSEENDNNLLFSGRLLPKKGAEVAIQAAIETGENLIILGVKEAQGNYWNDLIEPYLSDKITFQGYTDVSGRVKIYQKAKTAIFPFHWEEPFGLVLIEAMSCGTPVIAFARGSVSEVVKDGITGFIINSSENDIRGDWIIKKTGLEGIIEAIKRINSMSRNEYLLMRRSAREHIENNFTTEKMVEGYIEIYKKILG